jgi:signal transduction histidine kinase
VRLGIKGKQIAAVTAIVGIAVVALSALNVARLAGVVLHESHARAQLLSNAIFHRAREIVPGNPDPYAALRADPGMRSILESSIYGESVTSASILDASGVIVASSDQARVGQQAGGGADMAELLNQGAIQQLRVIYSPEGQTLDAREPMTLGDQAFGSIRIGVSTLLMRQELNASLRPALLTAAIALAVAILVAGLLAQLFLRPIHVIRSGLTRLGKGEQGVTLDLPAGDEFGDLGQFFNEISQQLSSDRTGLAGHQPALQSAVERAMAYSRKLVALGRLTAGIAHEVKNPLNAMMIHLELLRTKIRKGALSPIPEPQPVAAAGGLGLAEATRPAIDEAAKGALQHVEIIESEIRRLDEVVQGFLKFTRPEELRLEPVNVRVLLQELLPVIEPEARANNVKVVVEAPPSLPPINGDSAMLRQAFLNLAINACQAMPNGGTLRLLAAAAAHDRVEIRVEDTGIGIPPQHLQKIFDLYFTTKDHGTGIGLSMVYRIIQMHDGELEVQSTPGRGTTFRIKLPRAPHA